MSIALISIDGNIKLVANKISPLLRLQPGEFYAMYNPPVFDPKLQQAVPIVPVLTDTVEFSLVPNPEALLNLRKQKEAVIQNLLDSKAKEKGYDSILSAVSYGVDPESPFYTEALAYARWRSQCWAKGYDILAKVETGELPLPSDEELLQLMPELVL